jgi:hypothetical protein
VLRRLEFADLHAEQFLAPMASPGSTRKVRTSRGAKPDLGCGGSKSLSLHLEGACRR